MPHEERDPTAVLIKLFGTHWNVDVVETIGPSETFESAYLPRRAERAACS